MQLYSLGNLKLEEGWMCLEMVLTQIKSATMKNKANTPPPQKEKKLGIKIASCLISNKEWGVRIWRLTDIKEGWWCHSLSPGPPKGEQKSENYFHYLATCFHLFTRLILNAAIPIILAKRFSISQKPEFCWSIKNNEYVVGSRINIIFIWLMSWINIFS